MGELTIQPFKNYLELNPCNTVPWDSVCPIPLSFILNHKSVASLAFFKNILLDQLDKISVQTAHSSGKIDYKAVLQEEDFEALHNAFQCASSLIIPEILIDSGIITTVDEEGAQDPTLFERFNAGGTRITGEDLIYSVFKAYFPESKNLVEDIAVDFISPSRLINLFARFTQAKTQIQKNEAASYNTSIDIKTFKRLLRDEDFKNNFIGLLQDSEQGAKMKFRFLLDFFQGARQKNLLPTVLLKQLFSNNLDFLFIVLCYF